MKVKKNLNPAPFRVDSYMKTGDQLDAIIKTFRYLKNNGIDIGPDGEKLVKHSDDIKSKYPKSSHKKNKKSSNV